MEYTEKLMEEIDEALKDEAFTEKLAGAEDVETFKSIFAEKGITIDDVIAQSALDKRAAIAANGGELSEEDLELVAGGCKKCFWNCFVTGAVIGGAVGGLAGGLPGAVGGAVIGASCGTIIGVAVAIRHDTK